MKLILFTNKQVITIFPSKFSDYAILRRDKNES